MLKVIYLFIFSFLLLLFGMLYQACNCGYTCIMYNGYTTVFYRGADSTLLQNTDSINYADLRLKIDFITTSQNCQHRAIPFMNTAYAFKCEGEPIFLDSVKSLTVTSNVDYDNEHKANTSLNDILDVPADLQSLKKYYYRGTSFYLKLNKAPLLEAIHTFKVEVEMYNAPTTEKILPPIKLKF